MVTNSHAITQSSVKRATSKALANVMHSRELSRRDLADMLGCAPNTIINRLDADDSGHPPTIYELARGIQEFGLGFGNDVLLPLTGYKLIPTDPGEPCHDRTLTRIMEAAHEIAKAREDGEYSPEEDQRIAEALQAALAEILQSIAKGKGRGQ